MKSIKNVRVWVNWKLLSTGKVPYTPGTTSRASAADPPTWRTYEAACDSVKKFKMNGIGFVLPAGVACIDIDSDVDSTIAQEVKRLFQFTYQEVSPSGKGFHIVFKVDLDQLKRFFFIKKKEAYYMKNPHNGLEAYVGGYTSRFITYTGHRVGQCTRVKDCTVEFLTFLNTYMTKHLYARSPLSVKTKRVDSQDSQGDLSCSPKTVLSVTDIDTYLKWARKGKRGPEFSLLYDNLSTGNKSVDDLTLCRMLAFYLQGDEAAIDIAFRRSARYREKWEREDYRTETIRKAVEHCNGVFYKRPGRPSKVSCAEEDSSNKIKVEYSDEDERAMAKSNHLTLLHLEDMLTTRGVKVKYNEVLHDIDVEGVFSTGTLRGRVLTSEDVNSIIEFLFDLARAVYNYKQVTRAGIRSYLRELALKNRYNPILEHFNQSRWDGQDHLQKVYDALGVKDDLQKILILKWFWQGHALLRNDGTISPAGILVFQGPQGIGKTTFFSKAALQARWFGQGSIVSGVDKDLIRRTVSHFISELGELSGTLSRTDRNLLKIFVDRTKDTYRLPYDSTDTVHARRTNLCATVNENVFLVDPTGNRRFWTICLKSINKALINSIDFTQVWLQVWEQYAKDDLLGFRLTEEELSAVNNVNTQYEKSLEGEDEVRDIFSSDEVEYKYATVSVFKEAWPILHKYTARQLGMILDRLQIKQNIKTVKEGYRKYKTGRYRALPLPIYKSEGRGQRNDWSHLPSCPIDEIVRFGTEEQNNTLTPPELNLQPQRLKKSLRYKGKTIVYKIYST